jgi:hypothetical protein
MDEDMLRARIALWRARAAVDPTPSGRAADLKLADCYEALLLARLAARPVPPDEAQRRAVT